MRLSPISGQVLVAGNAIPIVHTVDRIHEPLPSFQLGSQTPPIHLIAHFMLKTSVSENSAPPRPHGAAILFIETKATVFGGQKALLARCAELDQRGLAYSIVHPFTTSDFLDQYQAQGLQGELVLPPRKLGKAAQGVFILRKLRRMAAVGRAPHSAL